jgi:hypothetical protein
LQSERALADNGKQKGYYVECSNIMRLDDGKNGHWKMSKKKFPRVLVCGTGTIFYGDMYVCGAVMQAQLVVHRTKRTMAQMM